MAAAAGALIVILGVFLPYLESGDFARIVDNSLIQHSEGKILIVLALVSILGLYRGANGDGWSWSVAALGTVMLALAVYAGANTPDLGSAASTDGLNLSQTLEVMSYRAESSPGIGIYAVGLGALLVCIGGVALARERSATDAPPADLIT